MRRFGHAQAAIPHTPQEGIVRTIAVSAAIVAVALVVLGLVLRAVSWLIVVGLVALLVAAIAGWIGVRRASHLAGEDSSR
jgi:hypothetical protein